MQTATDCRGGQVQLTAVLDWAGPQHPMVSVHPRAATSVIGGRARSPRRRTGSPTRSRPASWRTT